MDWMLTVGLIAVIFAAIMETGARFWRPWPARLELRDSKG
jgi:hypothetical protein